MGGTAADVHRSPPENLDMCSSYIFSAGIHRVLTNDSSFVLRADAVGDRACRDMMIFFCGVLVLLVTNVELVSLRTLLFF